MNELTVRILIASLGGIVAAWAKLDERKRMQRKLDDVQGMNDLLNEDRIRATYKASKASSAIASLLVMADLYRPRTSDHKAKRMDAINAGRSVLGEAGL